MSTGTPTPYAGLNQWNPEDKPKMNEFNADNRKIDQALCELDARLRLMDGGGAPVAYRNLLPVTLLPTSTADGVTFILNADQSITLTGTASADCSLSIFGSLTSYIAYSLLKAGKTYTFSAGNVSVPFSLGFCAVRPDGTITSFYEIDAEHPTKTVTPLVDLRVNYCVLSIAIGTVCDNVTFYPQITESTVTLPYKSWMDTDSEDPQIYRRNILPIMCSTSSYLGVNYTVNPDCSLTLNGTATQTHEVITCGAYNSARIYAKLKAGKTYTFSTGNPCLPCGFFYRKPDGTLGSERTSQGEVSKTFTMSVDGYLNFCRFPFSVNEVIENETFYLQITESTEVLPYKSWLE